MVDRSEKRIVVCGGGLAGLTAAITALDSGVPVTLFEKAPELGGNAAISGGVIWSFTEFDRIRAENPDGDAALQWLVYDNIDAARTWSNVRTCDYGTEQSIHSRRRRIHRQHAGALHDE